MASAMGAHSGTFIRTFREVLVSTLPIALLILALQIVLVGTSMEGVMTFVVCTLMVLFGFTIFLIGVESGVNPAGESMGHEISKRKSRLFMVGLVFIISFLVTVAEPDVTVFATQVTSLFTTLNKDAMVYAIAAGVAAFLIIAACKIVFRFSLRILLTIGYIATLVLTFIAPPEFIGIALDSGGVTTGPMTVPILLSLGIGLCSIHEWRNDLDGYGMIGLASIGPIIALLLMGIVSGDSSVGGATEEFEPYIENVFDRFLYEFEHALSSVLIAIVPLMAFFILFQKFVLFYTWNAINKVVKGVALASVGVIIFLTAIYTGYIPMATDVGLALADMPLPMIVLGFVLGFLVAIAEPAVEILAGRVESSSGGNIAKRIVKLVISVGVATFVALGMAKISFNFNLLYIIIPGYILALILMWLGDTDMVGISFDAGGVATGPMSVAIISTMYTGIASAKYTGAEAIINGFGVIALIALAPIIFLGAFSVYIKIMKKKAKA
jgi:hypothetical protein